MQTNQRKFQTGLLGWPVKHSISPAMHNAAFAAAGLVGNYALYPTEPENLQTRVEMLLDEGIDGLNVTIPHKLAVLDLPQVVEISEDVRQIGAANTLTRLPDGGLRATNTDWDGSRGDLLAHDVALNGETRCVILGTGGSSKALTHALNTEGVSDFWFVSRQAQGKGNVIGYTQLQEKIDDIAPDLIVNCTPVGMWPHVDNSPWPKGLPYPQGATVYDLIYRPEKTKLMRDAEEAGCKVIGGLGMLVRQAALSFEQWTGARASYTIMEEAARKALAHG